MNPETTPTGEPGWDKVEPQTLTHKSHLEDWRWGTKDYEGGGATSSRYIGPTRGAYPAPPCEPEHRAGVYLIQAQPSGRVKVGFSDDAERRLTQLQTGSPEHLTLVDVLDLDRASEKELHNRYPHLRVHGEWFEPEILDHLDEFPRA